MNAADLVERSPVTPTGDADQHFLVDDRVLDRILDYSPDDVEHVLEIGGGAGALTSRLLERYSVTVVELDRDLARFLETEFPQAEVVQGDATEVELPEFDACVSNLPYSASSPLLFRLLPRRRPLVLTLQKEFAERAAAEVGDDDYGRLPVAAGNYADVEVLETVPPSAFQPHPDVESAVARFTPTGGYDVDDEELYMDVVRAAFTQRRKTLRNALRNTVHITGVDEDSVDDLPESLLKKRPGKLSPKEYVEVTEGLR